MNNDYDNNQYDNCIDCDKEAIKWYLIVIPDKNIINSTRVWAFCQTCADCEITNSMNNFYKAYLLPKQMSYKEAIEKYGLLL